MLLSTCKLEMHVPSKAISHEKFRNKQTGHAIPGAQQLRTGKHFRLLRDSTIWLNTR